MKFSDFLTEDNINKENFSNLEKFMKKQPGFVSFTVKHDILTIVFKKNIQAIKAQTKSNKSFTEISAFGDSSAGDSQIVVELNKETIDVLNEAKTIDKEVIKLLKKGSVMTSNDKGVMVNFEEYNNGYFYGIDQNDNEIEESSLKYYSLEV